jgi:UDP:flavonoid glycosyltransferase YjiC (YdhE family)
MATIIICPFPEIGHINPTFKLAKGLKQAGHQVYYLGLADFQDYIELQQLDFIPLLESRYPKGSSGERSAQMKLWRLALIDRDAQSENPRNDANPFDGIKEEIAKVIKHRSPDLFIADVLIGGLAYLVNQEFAVTSALLSVTLLEGPMIGEPAPDAPYPDLPVLVLCPLAFDFPGARGRKGRYYIEPSIDLARQELRPFPWETLHRNKRLIYCSFGSESHLYDKGCEVMRAVIEAVRSKKDCQLVLSIGPYLEKSNFDSPPDNVLIVNWAPQLEMLARATIMITHGGIGTIKECIFLGVPMIVLPFRWDQPNNAARVVAHGLGLRGNSNQPSAQEIFALINAIVDEPAFKHRINRMSAAFRQMENSRIGISLIEEILCKSRRKETAIPSSRELERFPSQAAAQG